jgi:hypothetical protein
VGRSWLAVGFIVAIGATGIYFARRPTYASGEVLAAELVEANSTHVRAMKCDKEVEIGPKGAHFVCWATFKDGEIGRLEFQMDREGMIKQAQATPHPKVKHTSDPWDD